MTNEERQILLEDNVEYFENLLAAAKEMASGVPATKACADHDIGYASYRDLIGREHLGYKSRLDMNNLASSQPLSDLRHGLLSWQENLWLSIFGEMNLLEIPPDIDKAVSNALHSRYISDRERKIILMRYREGMTQEEIGTYFGVTKQRIMQVEIRVLRKLRHSSVSKNLRYGDAVRKKYEELREARMNPEISEKVKEIENDIQGAIMANDAQKLIALRKEIDRFLTDTGQEEKLELHKMSIDELDLSVRSWNCLRHAGIYTLGDLAQKTTLEMMKIHGLGRKSLIEVLTKAKKGESPSRGIRGAVLMKKSNKHAIQQNFTHKEKKWEKQ